MKFKSPEDAWEISIHALPRRATRFLQMSDRLYNDFNPRPPAEGDPVSPDIQARY